MEPLLLKSKIRFPARPAEMVARPSLLAALDRAVAGHRLVLVTAPAGYGKTMLLAEWSEQTTLPVAWVSLGEEDEPLERFLRYLLAAWQRLQPEIVKSRLGMLLAALGPDRQEILVSFLNAAEQAPEGFTFILDDYHRIHSPGIHEAVAYLLDHLPPHVHFVIISRSEPPLPLARYRARRQVFELRIDDLRFSPEESAAFLRQALGFELPAQETAALQQDTEGWVAGLQLAALMIRRSGKAPGSTALSGEQRLIADYLAEEVFAHLPETMQEFLLKTSLLDRLCASLCEALVGSPGAQAMLDELERENLFILPLDERREWFRYHSLFAEFLQARLKRQRPTEIDGLHARAARWFMNQDLPGPAFQHALAGSQLELVVEIINNYVTGLLNAGEMWVVKRWLDALPAEWFSAYPVLGLARAGFLAFSGEIEACYQCIDDVEARLQRMERQEAVDQLARVSAVRCLMACVRNDLSQALSYASQALEVLPENDTGFRPSIYAALGDTYRKRGDWENARRSYFKLLEFSDSFGVQINAAHAYGALADLALQQGRLRAAHEHWLKALSLVQNQASWGNYPLPVIGWIYTRLGELYYEWNDLDQAKTYLEQGAAYAELGGDVRARIASYIDRCRLELADGQLEIAQEYLERARPLVEGISFVEWAVQFERLQLELWIAQGNLRQAVQWAEALLSSGRLQAEPENAALQLAFARALVARGDISGLQQVRNFLTPLVDTALKEGRKGEAIEAHALLALAAWMRGNQPQALTHLEQALRLAEPEGYLRLFADLGLAMGRLLQEAQSRQVMPAATARLLAAFDGKAASQPVAALPEPLTDREQEILKLIAAGLSNREIAGQLVISPETVKKHTGNIYGKLGVSSRTQATARAKELDWIL